jgi:hypothetical protein
LHYVKEKEQGQKGHHKKHLHKYFQRFVEKGRNEETTCGHCTQPFLLFGCEKYSVYKLNRHVTDPIEMVAATSVETDG